MEPNEVAQAVPLQTYNITSLVPYVPATGGRGSRHCRQAEAKSSDHAPSDNVLAKWLLDTICSDTYTLP